MPLTVAVPRNLRHCVPGANGATQLRALLHASPTSGQMAKQGRSPGVSLLILQLDDRYYQDMVFTIYTEDGAGSPMCEGSSI